VRHPTSAYRLLSITRFSQAAESDALVAVAAECFKPEMCSLPIFKPFEAMISTNIYARDETQAKSRSAIWLSCVIDEIHLVRTGNRKQVAMAALVARTVFSIGMSATPIQNKLMVVIS
jgi:hypothetical protein